MMDRRIAAATVAFFSLSGAAAADASASRVMRVAEAKRDFDALDGQVITVRGWIAPCMDLCGIFSSRGEARRGTITGWALVIRPDQAFLAEAGRGVREVVVEGRVVVTCRNERLPDGSMSVCLEQSGHIVPTAAVRPATH